MGFHINLNTEYDITSSYSELFLSFCLKKHVWHLLLKVPVMILMSHSSIVL